jgi:hypothetical protein
MASKASVRGVAPGLHVFYLVTTKLLCNELSASCPRIVESPRVVGLAFKRSMVPSFESFYQVSVRR